MTTLHEAQQEQPRAEPTYRHTRYDDIRNGNNDFVFEREEYLTKEDVMARRFCSFIKEEQGSNVFCCTSPLRHDGDRLCETHYRLWLSKKKDEEAARQKRRDQWFERECEKEFQYMLENPGNLTFSKEVTTREQKENVMWGMAEALVASRDKFATKKN